MGKKILVIRFSSIGDIVLTTPVVRCLKRQLGVEVHFLTGPRFSSILKANPYIDRIWAMEEDLSGVLRKLREENFHEVIDLHHNLRSLRIKRGLGLPVHSFRKLNVEKWLLVRFGIDRLPRVHIVDRYMETVAHLGVLNDGEGLDFFIDENDKAFAESLISSWSGRPYLAFALGAAHATKCIPEAKVRDFLDQTQHPVVLLGGPEEKELGERLQDGDHVINVAGRSSIGQSAALISGASLVLTPDTGMMHIAAALKVPILSIWGNTIPEFGMTPYYGHHSVITKCSEVQGLSCRPCSKIGFNKCPKGHFRCMMEQDPEQWVAFSDEILSS